jgi:ribosome-binding protein aMBF1 (putative translation factor)
MYVDGVSEGTKLASDASSRDPEIGLRSVAALRRLVERLEALQVENARDRGWSWQEIASRLEVSKQAVHKKHAGRRVLGRRR